MKMREQRWLGLVMEPPGGEVPSYQAGADAPVPTITAERKEFTNGKEKSN